MARVLFRGQKVFSNQRISLAVKQYICEARPFALLKLDMELNLVILFTKNLSLFILPKKSLMTQNGTSVSHAYD